MWSCFSRGEQGPALFVSQTKRPAFGPRMRAHEDVTPGKQPRAPDLVPRCVNAGDTSVYPQTITGVPHAIEKPRPGRGAARLDGGNHQGHRKIAQWHATPSRPTTTAISR